MANKVKFRPTTGLIALFVVLAVLYGLILAFAYRYLNRSLFHERASTLGLVMEKVADNAETGMESRWRSLHHMADRVAEEGGDLVTATEELKLMMEHWPDETIGLFLVDTKGICHDSEGNTFLWYSESKLESGEDELTIDRGRYDGETDELYLITPFDTPISLEDGVFTHIGLACEMSFIDSYFHSRDYGSNSYAFIVDRYGSCVYREVEDADLVLGGDLFPIASVANYRHGTSYTQLVEELYRGAGGCVNIVLDGESYYLVYEPLRLNGWMAAIAFPENESPDTISGFMETVVYSVIALALFTMLFLTIVLIAGNSSVRKKREAAEAQLLRAVEAERSANDAKTQFLSSMSHDIRTPMNAIVGMTALASKRVDEPDYIKSCLSKITLASNHLLTLINDVLDISKVESGRMSLNPVVFSLAESAANLANIVRQQIIHKGQSFDIRVHNMLYENLFADELRLNQIFINILTNAVKYTPEGGRITVDIKEEAVVENPGAVRVIYIVEDNGVGMSKEFQRNMYDSFARAKNEASGIQGTGLGLAICRKMVLLMGGDIACESELGKGTKFTVTLLLPIAEEVTERLMLPPMHVLLVDDDEIFRETAAGTLAEIGLTADCAADGEKAVAMVVARHEQGRDYPVVIVDWRMPGMSGRETVIAIREKVGDEVPIIVISAYDRADIEEEARAAGANGFISKPFFPSGVYRDMSAILGIDRPDDKREEKQRHGLEGMSILVAEDNDLNWEIAHELLNMYGIKTVRAENGRRCVDMLEDSGDGEYELVLMDIQMPEMNGYEAAEAIRSSAREYLRSLPIIAMTADAFADDIRRCLDVGMNAHIAKPINMNILLELLETSGQGQRHHFKDI